LAREKYHSKGIAYIPATEGHSTDWWREGKAGLIGWNVFLVRHAFSFHPQAMELETQYPVGMN